MTRLAVDIEPRSRPSRRSATVLGCLLAVVLVSGLVLVSYQAGLRQRDPTADLPPEFATLADLYDRLRREAVRVPDDADLAQGAVEGMLDALGDPHAAYYDAEHFAAFNQMLEGAVFGVGIQIEDGDEGIIVVKVLESTPAADAGVVAGERIVSVDGQDVQALPTEHVVALITGEPGTPVTIGFEGGPTGPRELRMTRAEIQLPYVESRLEGGLGYIEVAQFSDRVGARVRQAAADLTARGARGIVLDLRSNPGGLLREAIDVASVFIEDGVIVTVRSRSDGDARGDTEEVYEAEGDALDELPLVVLVDGWSASASEIVAGAIQDLNRGEVVGQQTYGKGTVQTVQILDEGGGVKFTTAEYLTPSGDSIEGVGVVPDREVADPDAQLATARETLLQLLAAAPR